MIWHFFFGVAVEWTETVQTQAALQMESSRLDGVESPANFPGLGFEGTPVSFFLLQLPDC